MRLRLVLTCGLLSAARANRRVDRGVALRREPGRAARHRRRLSHRQRDRPGLWSYYNFDNWTYQPSYVSSNTPWFFNGVRAEFTYRHASVPYFSGPGGITPPGGSPGTFANVGAPGSMVPGWSPDLVQDEPRMTLALLVKL